MPQLPKNQTDTNTISATMMLRAAGYAVALLGLVVGTATLMLGFALGRSGILNVACVLYSVAVTASAGRLLLVYRAPRNFGQALLLLTGALLCAAACYGVLGLTLSIF